MAIKEKKEEQESRLLQILKSESKFLNYFLMFVALVLTIIATFLLNGTLEIRSTVLIIGSFPKTFTIIILILGIVSFIYGAYPFAKASYPELKHVTWPTKKLFATNTAKVFSFLIVLTLLFLMYDVLISELISGILKIK